MKGKRVPELIASNAKWICADSGETAPILYKTIRTAAAEHVAISICGLGFFELQVNGEKVSEDHLVPVWSDYEPRFNRRKQYALDDTMYHRIYYVDYDLTPYWRTGDNQIEVWLGNGWYNQRGRLVEGELWYGCPKLIFTVEVRYTDGMSETYSTNETMRYRLSPVVFNNVYLGERWDFRVPMRQEERPVRLAQAPQGEMCLQDCPADREIRTISPVLVHEDGDVRIYDLKEHFSGYMVGRAKGPVRIRYADALHEDFSLDFSHSGGEEQIQRHEYLGADEYTFRPKFSLCGFRYCEVTGQTEDLLGVVVHAAIRPASYFRCSNGVLNWLYEAYIRTQLANMHYGVPSDCPHRERLGYTGDGQLTCRAGMMLLDSREFYRKWMRDIADSQDVFTGHVQHTAPFYGGGGGPGGWGCAIVTVPYTYYSCYGDIQVLRQYFPHMLRWAVYMNRHSEGGLITREENGGWCLGDWIMMQSMEIPPEFVNTCLYIRSLMMMIDIARLLDDSASIPELEDQLQIFRRGVVDAYKHDGHFLDGIQGADAFAAAAGLGDGRVTAALHERYATATGYDTGIFGTELVTRVLFECGYAQTAFSLLTAEGKNTFTQMIRQGASTIYENWTGDYSQNQPMLGAVVTCLFDYVLGIYSLKAGYEQVRIEPRLVREVDFAEGWLDTVRGRVSVRYCRDGDEVRFSFSIPQGIEAAFCFGGRTRMLPVGESELTEKAAQV